MVTSEKIISNCLCVNEPILIICPAVWGQHLHGCSGLLFSCIIVTIGAVKQTHWWRSGHLSVHVRVPLLCNSHVTLMVQERLAGVSAHLVNKQSVQTQKGNRPDSYSYHHFPLRPKDPGALFITVSDPSRLQEHCVPALPQPDKESAVHTHPAAANTVCYWSV